MPQTIPITKTKGLSGYAPEIEEAVFEFQRTAYPDRSAALIPQRWRWMFVESARRLGVDPMVWVYLKDSAVLAHQGAIAVRLQIAGQERTTGWFVDTMALPAARGKAIGPMLVKKALDDLPMNLSLGQTQDMRELQFALGWQQVVPLNTYMFLLRPEKVLAEKLPGRVLGALAGSVISSLGNIRRSFKGWRCRGWTRNAITKPKWTTHSIDRFDQRHDQLWQSVASHYPCAVVRDASFLNWKFVDQPGQEFTRLETTCDDQIVSVATFTVREPDQVYAYRRAWLTDLVIDPTDHVAMWQTLSAVQRECQGQNIDAIVFDVSCPAIEQAVRSFGFWKRDSTRVFLLATDGLTEQEQQIALNPNSWYLTKADSDIDRP